MWVADWGDDKLYAYDLATKARLPAKDFVTLGATGNTAPTGIWSDGTNMWVADLDDDKLYAYDAKGLINPSSLSSLLTNLAAIAASPDLIVNLRSSRTDLTPSETITLTAMLRNTGGSSAAAITLRWYRSADSTIDTTDTQVSNTALSSLAAGGSSNVSVSITLPDTPSTNYYGVCVDPVAGEHYTNDNCSSVVRVVAAIPDLSVSVSPSHANVAPADPITLRATLSNTGAGGAATTTLRWYHSTNTTLDTNTDTPVGTNAVRILAGGTSLTLSNRVTVPSNSGAYYYYACVDPVIGELETPNNCSSAMRVVVILGVHLPTSDFNTLSNANNRNPRGIWSDGTNMWVGDADDNKLYAYDLATKERVPAQDFDTLSAADNRNPSGMWSDGTTLWVADLTNDKLYAYSLATKEHLPAKDFALPASNRDPNGIWSDGATMWVADDGDDKLYAYDLATRARTTNEDFDTLTNAGNTDPRGIWSDGTTMWVGDSGDDKLYAYSLATKERLPAKDFTNLRAAGNESLNGIWSDGNTMWVADSRDDKLYAYSARFLIDPTSLSSVLMRVANLNAVPDLVVTLSASSTSVAPSNTITLRARVWNTGARSSSASTLRWYFSADSALDTNADTSDGDRYRQKPSGGYEPHDF